MRLQVGLRAAAALLLLPLSAQGDGRAGAWLSVYSDDDALTVLSPQVNGEVELEDRYQLEAGYDADIITAASVDVVSAASPRGYEEVRHGLRLGAGYRPNAETTLSARYVPSWEPDYRSQGFAAAARTELWQRNIDLRIDGRLNVDRVGRSGEPESTFRDLTQGSVGLSFGLSVDPKTTLQIAYEVQLLSGFQASPYRFVAINWTDPAQTRVQVPEQSPEERVRHALAVGTKKSIATDWFWGVSYRFYTDSWGVVSHTGETQLEHAFFNDRVVLGGSLRGYVQGDASFYRERYRTAFGRLPKYRVADKVLSRQWSWLAGLRSEAELARGSEIAVVRATMKMEILDQRFQNFAPLDGRRAVITSLGVSGEM